uniref:Chitin-binding type-2 domain-containing protein n=1 Tax=Magallana gigas TaxID=29159 RepID=K1Q679_MAGGI
MIEETWRSSPRFSIPKIWPITAQGYRESHGHRFRYLLRPVRFVWFSLGQKLSRALNDRGTLKDTPTSTKMRFCLVIYSLLNLWKLSWEFPEERQAGLVPNCGDTWSNVGNPCQHNPDQQLYYPHPHDADKFIQCTKDGEMYIIQCPAGKEYNPSVTQCAHPVTTTAPLPAVTNPCTQDVVAAKKIFFPYPNDPSRFMMCEGVMQVNIMTCPSPLVWDQGRESCVYTVLTGSQPSPNVVTTVAPDYSRQKCPNTTLPTDEIYFPHPDASKFIQCAAGGTAYVLNCPEGTIWRESAKKCLSPFASPDLPPTL